MHAPSIAQPVATPPVLPTRRARAADARLVGAWRCTLRLVPADGGGRVAQVGFELREEAGTLVGASRPQDGPDEGLDGTVRGHRSRDRLVLCLAEGLGRAIWVLEGRVADGRVRGRASRARRARGTLPSAEGVFELERA